MEKERVHVLVTGRVQGVFFRESTRREAETLGVTGWVKNLPDGRVEATFEGEREAIRKIVEFVRRGPQFARVDDVTISKEVFRDEFRAFSIVRKAES